MALINSAKPTKKVHHATDYSQHLQATPVVSHTSVHKSVPGHDPGPQSESKTEHQGLVFLEQTAMKISVEAGRVINLGNYESARIGVTLTAPCSKETLNETYDWATTFVSDKIEEAIKMAKGL